MREFIPAIDPEGPRFNIYAIGNRLAFLKH
jgi:hypothetical protein